MLSTLRIERAYISRFNLISYSRQYEQKLMCPLITKYLTTVCRRIHERIELNYYANLIVAYRKCFMSRRGVVNTSPPDTSVIRIELVETHIAFPIWSRAWAAICIGILKDKIL